MNCDPRVSRCLSPLVGTAGSYINPVLVLPQPSISSPDGVAEEKMAGRGQWKTDISTQFG